MEERRSDIGLCAPVALVPAYEAEETVGAVVARICCVTSRGCSSWTTARRTDGGARRAEAGAEVLRLP